jgi:hypothetical protein
LIFRKRIRSSQLISLFQKPGRGLSGRQADRRR